MYKSSCFLVLASCISLISFSQDTHYWSKQFGDRSALLSGAVLGGAQDNTMIFYNPGALGLLENSSISINANAYSLETITVDNALGQQADFESAKISSVPLLAGGMFTKDRSDWKIGYAILNSVKFDFQGIARIEGEFDLIEEGESSGLEESVSEASLTTSSSELNFVFGAGKQVNENFSYGFSNLFILRSYSYQRSLSTYSFLNNQERTLIGGNLNQNSEYYNLRYVLKLGLVYKTGNWSTGLTLTSPSVNLFGQGTVASNIAASNLKLIDDNRISGVATARQAELKSTFKSPFSVAVGTNYEKGKSYFGVSLQYFAGIDTYDILSPIPTAFVRPTELAPQLQSDQFLQIKSGANSVFNVALGYEYDLSESISLLFGARNDMSYFDEASNQGPGINSSISTWDIYHFSGGVTINRQNSSLSLGLLYSTGKDNRYEQQGSFNPDELDLIQGSTTITNANYNNIGILLGYTFYFKKFEFKQGESN